jgi:hypothetical protein
MYTDLKTAFNDNTEDIDKLARDIHNKKTTMFNSVYDDYNKQKLKWDQDIKEYNTGKMHPNNLTLDTSDSISIDSISIDSPELDSIIDSGKFKQNHISTYVKKNNRCKHMKKDEDIFFHIKNCFDCRNKLIKHLKNNTQDKTNYEKTNYEKTNYEKTNYEKTNYEKTNYEKTNYTEISIIIIIGIVVIFILDFLMKSLIQSSIQ